MKNRILFFLCAMLPVLGRAQDAYTLKFMPQLPQSQWCNASNETSNKVTIGLPALSGISFYFYNSGFTYHDIFKKINDSTSAIHPGNIINGLKTNNYIGLGLGVSLFSLTISKPGYSVGFSINDKVDIRFNYPKDLFSLLWNGNGAYIGKTLDIGNFGLNASWYREYALHVTKTFGKWTFGASPKLLFGKANINTRESSLTLYTDPSYYALTGTAKLNVQTSGLHDSDDKSDFDPVKYVLNTQNKGYAVDLGARYEFNEKLTVAVGLNDLGFIHWQSGIYNYTSGPATFTWDGFHVEDYLHGDTSLVSAQKLTDSVTNLIKFHNNKDAYTTTLPYNFFGIATYKLGKNIFGLQLSAERFNKNFLYAGTASYQLKLGKHLTAGLTYTAKTSSPFNIGGALMLQFLGMQYYFITDNWWAPVRPLDSKNVNLQFGMNLVFGNKVRRKKNNDTEMRLDTETKVDGK